MTVYNEKTLPRYTRYRAQGYTVGIYGSQILFNKSLALKLANKRVSFGTEGSFAALWADDEGYELKHNPTSHQFSIVHAHLAGKLARQTGYTRFTAHEIEPLKFLLKPIQQ